MFNVEETLGILVHKMICLQKIMSVSQGMFQFLANLKQALL